METSQSTSKFLAFVLSLLFLNLVALDLWFLKQRFLAKTISPTIQEEPKKIAEKATDQSCPTNCIDAINEATSSIKLSTTIKTAPTAASASIAKEFFISIGSGTSSAEDWADIPGAQIIFDTGNYGKLKKALFEVSVHVPTANQYVYTRLYNVTDNHAVAGSEVYYPGGGDQLFLTSGALALTSGNKLYKVQMKTQLKYPAILDQSRLHITTY